MENCLTRKQVAAFFRVSVSAIDDWCRKKEGLPYFPSPGGKRFEPAQIKAWIQARRRNDVCVESHIITSPER